MSGLDDFLTPTLARQLEAGPALWSARDPVTNFGAERSAIGVQDVHRGLRRPATRSTDLTDYRFDLVAAGAGGALAYLAGHEHVAHTVDGVRAEPYILRVTHLYRREDGAWKLVHRHGDHRPPPRSAQQ